MSKFFATLSMFKTFHIIILMIQQNY